jgi:hypothetical protein
VPHSLSFVFRVSLSLAHCLYSCKFPEVRQASLPLLRRALTAYDATRLPSNHYIDYLFSAALFYDHDDLEILSNKVNQGRRLPAVHCDSRKWRLQSTTTR